MLSLFYVRLFRVANSFQCTSVIILLQKSNGSAVDDKITPRYELTQFETPELDVFAVNLIHTNIDAIWFTYIFVLFLKVAESVSSFHVCVSSHIILIVFLLTQHVLSLIFRKVLHFSKTRGSKFFQKLQKQKNIWYLFEVSLIQP